eukprot:753985-Hanusia_phi.AAC.2
MLIASGQPPVHCVSEADFLRFGSDGVMAAGGDSHSLLLVKQRMELGVPGAIILVPRLYVMGSNDEGQLGLGNFDDHRLPFLVQGLQTFPQFDTIHLSASDMQVCLLPLPLLLYFLLLVFSLLYFLLYFLLLLLFIFLFLFLFLLLLYFYVVC